jgi:carboxymethylenebutenolidase
MESPVSRSPAVIRNALGIVLMAACWLRLVPAADAQSASCQFSLGFAALHDLDPADIGDCIDNQTFAGNGDAQQHTTLGLMAWRKADNWTAFTNGYRTWINGPNGLVSRLNTDRFAWESGPAAASSTPQRTDAFDWLPASAQPCLPAPDALHIAYTNGRMALTAVIDRPSGPGPFPAVLLLHNSLGLQQQVLDRAAFLAAHGYVAVAPDYLTPEKLEPFNPADVNQKARLVLEDMARATDCLKSLPFVAADRLGLMAFSFGGAFGFTLMTRGDFKAYASWYGAESTPQWPALNAFTVAPRARGSFLLLQGDQDNPNAAQAIHGLLVKAGQDSSVLIYPNTTHAFDQPDSPFPGLRYDPRVTADAESRTLAFFNAKLV